jgi:hypothetical protein
MLVGLGPTGAYKRRAKAPHNQTEYRDIPITSPNPRTIVPQRTIPIQHTPMDLFATLSSIVFDTVTPNDVVNSADNGNCIVV